MTISPALRSPSGNTSRGRLRRLVGAAAVIAVLVSLAPAPASGERFSTPDATGISDPLAFVLSDHFPDLSGYEEFHVAMNGPDRCARISPLPCD